ncbi:MAG: hypothetical protein U0531_03970 [Dehalococcoidia bacterium]
MGGLTDEPDNLLAERGRMADTALISPELDQSFTYARFMDRGVRRA